MVRGAEKSALFSIHDQRGKTVYSAPVRTSTGTWGAFSVYALDFTLAKAGQYTISVRGTIPASSPKFSVDSAGRLYSDAIENALFFHQSQRDGWDFIPSELRDAPGHLNDRQAAAYQSPVFDANDGIVGALVPTGFTVDAEAAGGTRATTSSSFTRTATR